MKKLKIMLKPGGKSYKINNTMDKSFLQAVRNLGEVGRYLDEATIIKNYEFARDAYSKLGIDTDEAMDRIDKITVSSPCWCLDNVVGYEVANPSGAEVTRGAGLQAIEKSQGMPRNLMEHMADLKFSLGLIPGPNGVLVHNIYADTDGKYIPRNEHSSEHFEGWVKWGRDYGIELHMNPSPFNHPMVVDGFTLASKDPDVRDYWIQEIRNTRRIASYIGGEQEIPSVHNIWVPDGSMDNRIDRAGPRERLWESLEACLEEDLPNQIDAVEGKLFGIGLEDYTVGSHELYADFSAEKGTILCIDTGHFTHMDPRELPDKISSHLVSRGRKGILMHVSYPVKWDSDFVARSSDWLNGIADAVKRSGKAEKVYWGNDFFQPGAQPIASLVLGGRATRKSILHSYLDPFDLPTYSESVDKTNMVKLALTERRRELPFGAVWDMYCLRNNVPAGLSFLNEVSSYEETVMSKR